MSGMTQLSLFPPEAYDSSVPPCSSMQNWLIFH